MNDWYTVADAERILSPALLFYPERIQRNIERMIAIAGQANRLRPHVKTYKCAEIIRLQLAAGITRFKCATLAEVQLLLETGARDILLAYLPVGPAVEKFRALVVAHPEVRLACLIDGVDRLGAWRNTDPPIRFYLDLDVGMGRTGIAPAAARELFDALQRSPHEFAGLHIYDGHIREADVAERRAAVRRAYAQAEPLIAYIDAQTAEPYEIVCGGSISFSAYAEYERLTLSPGTTLLWDWGYGSRFPDLGFAIAAVLLTRVISKPGTDRLCLDLGHKAVGSEMTELSVHFPQLPDARKCVHSEEHLVVSTQHADRWPVGAILYGFPRHVCPTVALHEQALVVEQGRVVGQWAIAARRRIYLM